MERKAESELKTQSNRTLKPHTQEKSQGIWDKDFGCRETERQQTEIEAEGERWRWMESKKEKEKQRQRDNSRPRDRERDGWIYRENEAETAMDTLP